MTVDEAIENLADELCKLGNPAYREVYVESLNAIARLAEAELVNRMQLHYVQMTIPLGYLRH